jgi:RNA polymerase sigma-54 factor
MAISQRLDLRQGQSLVMTPQLQQAIKLLQLSNLEVVAFVEEELESNPLLEHDEGEDRGQAVEPGLGEAGEAGPAASDAAEEMPDTLDRANSEELPSGADAPLDTDFENQYDTSAADSWAPSPDSATPYGPGGSFEEGARSLEQRLTEPATLRQHLLDQLQMDFRDPVDRMIGLHLIEMLDEAGYLTGQLEPLAELLGCELGRIEATLQALQRFDPTGIFARSLSECLALQLAERDRLDPAMQAMLDHLDLLAKGDLGRLRKICGVDDEDLTEMIAEIRALDPKPAQIYDFQVADPIIPDILMRPDGSGGWIVELNNETLPRVLINGSYHARVAKQARSKKEKEYIASQFQSANWLVKSLHQRATTILKVSTEIVRQQDPFFRKGVSHMKPLTLRHIAEVIEMHESTVSRVTSNKYMATPRGIYELKYFFTAAIGGADGKVHSAESVRARIKGLIDAENGAKVLSDDSIVGLLRAEGIDIARRTVAKYREAMRIPSSVQRRRARSLGL